MNAVFKKIIALLDEKFPKAFSCKPSKYGQADILLVKCSTRAGSAMGFSLDHNGGLLLSLNEADQNADDEEDDGSEGWYTNAR